MVLTTSVTTTTRMASVLSDTTVASRLVASLLSVMMKTGRHPVLYAKSSSLNNANSRKIDSHKEQENKWLASAEREKFKDPLNLAPLAPRNLTEAFQMRSRPRRITHAAKQLLTFTTADL